MNKLLLAAVVVPVLNVALARAADSRVFEMRTYYAAPGKLDAVHTRFRDHACRLLAKHGIAQLGFWVPADNVENKLIWVAIHPSREAAAQAWKSFFADPDWQKAFKESEANGKLVEKVETRFLTATDFSPEIKPVAAGDRVFEMRTYTAESGRLPNLLARFRDHTVKLFKKHGITNIAYWTLMPDQPGADSTLIYILAHKSQEAAKASFAAFRADPDWIAARKASEAKAGGSLTVKDGVKSL
ncbi:MAG: NIPSNAP family protein, partial [Verrucomicrobiae bacterium]|nr:NIPSNAP family protein [Verrucomicrobiae bacterium]